MKPALWGPGLWHLMFSITWNCRDHESTPALMRVIFYHIPTLLPCKLCQEHYVKHRGGLNRRLGEPKTSAEVLTWLYYLKDEVNKGLRTRSISLDELRQRFLLFGGRLDDVLVADTLVMLAIATETTGDEDVFIDFCTHLTRLLPLPADSELLRNLQRVRRPVTAHAYRVCKNTRIEHGIRFPTLDHFRRSLA